MEVWKEVKDYEGAYKISNLGNVLSCKYVVPRLLTPDKSTGYYRVCLSKKGFKKQTLIHRLIADHFILNPNNKTQVNHIDENKLNNSISNLEWVTHRENIEHSLTKKGISKIKGVNWINRSQSYQCSIYLNRKKHYLGTYKDIEKAKKIVSNFLTINNLN